MLYAMPGSESALHTFANRYENFIGGEWVAPLEGKYFENISPVTGAAYCEVARSTPADLNKALDAAHAAADAWGVTPVAERSRWPKMLISPTTSPWPAEPMRVLL